MGVKYKRFVLKLSGEYLGGSNQKGIDTDVLTRICEGIRDAYDLGCEIAIVVGGGNFWRGRDDNSIEKTRSDHMGMLGTVINALAVADTLEKLGLEVRVQTAITMQAIAEPYIRARAIRHLEKGRIVILACGTGNTRFSTDTAAALRCAEIGGDIIFKATLVDGVYDKDPNKHADATMYRTLTFDEFLEQKLQVMDTTAASMCRDNDPPTPVLVFGLSDPANIARAARGDDIGTYISK